MAEICIDCWIKETKGRKKRNGYVITKNLELCEICGEYKNVIICTRKVYLKNKYPLLFLPYDILFFLWRLLILPYLIIKNWKYLKEYIQSPDENE